MNSVLRRYGLAGILCVAGIAMLVGGAIAAVDPFGREPAVAEAVGSASTARSGGLALEASLSIDTPVAPVEPVAVHAAPEIFRTLPAPGASFDRDDLDLEQAGLGVDASLSLASGSHVGKTRGSASPLATASAQAVLVPVAVPVAVAAAAFTVASLIVYFWTGFKTWALRLTVFPAVALYAKITRAEVFDNGVRERIFGAIRANPGVSASDLARAANVSWGTTIYHLDVLEQTRMVTSLRNGRYRRYFENGANLTSTKEAVAVLQNTVTASVVESIKTSPGTTQKELAAATSMTPQALHWHLTRLVATGIVRKEREGRVVRHFVE